LGICGVISRSFSITEVTTSRRGRNHDHVTGKAHPARNAHGDTAVDVRRAAEAIAFYKKAFDAVEMMRLPGKDVGDRYGQLEDPFGHRWSGATHIPDMSAEEMQQAMQKMGG
jgi:hypothetical protein